MFSKKTKFDAQKYIPDLELRVENSNSCDSTITPNQQDDRKHIYAMPVNVH